ncbi:MAG: hypothetical protein ACI86H_002598 [bacterium]|jgi:hypothetical protein
MGIIDICRTAALQYSKEVCKPDLEYGNVFPKYFDWSDHIASEDTGYSHHLNKAAEDIEKLAKIFKEHCFHTNSFEAWKNDWLEQTIAAAWIHDVGMIKDRNKHDFYSAQFLFTNEYGFNFSEISEEDRIKIGLLCIKHNRGWGDTYSGMKKILSASGLSLNLVESYFNFSYSPSSWKLDLAGRLISTSDCLRYRGKDLQNDLQQTFYLWCECNLCKTVYTEPREFCSTANCQSGKPIQKVAIPHKIEGIEFNPQTYSKIKIYQPTLFGNAEKIEDPIQKASIIAIREEDQLYTRGDMSLSGIEILDYNNWFQNLKRMDINCEFFDDYDEEKYKTVIQVTLDHENFDAAIFTLSKYITEFLHDNITFEEDSLCTDFLSNSCILQIKNTSGKTFTQYYQEFDQSVYNEQVKESITTFEDTLKNWQSLDNIVLPVELNGKIVEVIKL